MKPKLNTDALNQLFTEARTHNQFTDESVPEALIRQTYDLMKMGPTSSNCSPARIIFVTSEEGKARLSPHLFPGNREKSMSAPWVAIIAHDLDFVSKLGELFPHNPDVANWFADPMVKAETAFRNGTLQGAYLMMAARALGLSCGPMSGFDRAGVDKEFFSDSDDKENWTANFICNIGYGSDEGLFPRLPRLDFEDACEIV